MDEQPKTTLTDGSEVTPDHLELKDNGQQKGYVVLAEEERAKGFVRPYRTSYVHRGPKGPQNLRDLTEEERKDHAQYGYVKFEEYGPGRSPIAGRFWTQQQLDHATQGGCGTLTTMPQAISETYARDPRFYSGTFCCGCGKHLPVAEFVWDGTDERVGS